MSSGKQLGVKAFVSPGSDEFLFLLRKYSLPGERQPGWDIPGGRIVTDKKTNITENPVSAVSRETFEETGLKLNLGYLRVAGFQTFEIKPARLTVERTYFLADHIDGQAVVLDPKEHIDYRWATIRLALGTLPLNPMLEEFLRTYSGNVSGIPTSSQITIQ